VKELGAQMLRPKRGCHGELSQAAMSEGGQRGCLGECDGTGMLR